MVHISNMTGSCQEYGKRLLYYNLTLKYRFNGEEEVRVVYHLFIIYGSTFFTDWN